MMLALDLGSTNFKAAVFDAGLTRLGQSSVAVPYLRHDGERAELDPAAVWTAVVEAIRGACGLAGVATTAIETLAATSQAQTFTILDHAGRARLPLISWRDWRARAEAADLWDKLAPDWHRHCSFAKLTGNLMAAQLLWVRRHVPDAYDGAPSVVMLPSFVYQRLFGVNRIDRNLAAMSGVYSLARGEWREPVLQLCGVPPAALPQGVEVGMGELLPTRCPELGLRGAIRLVPAGNDQTAGAYGNGCGPGDVVVTIGTALVAYRFAGAQPGPYHENGCWGPYPGGGYYEMAVRDEGGQALDWARDELMAGAGVAEFDAAAARGRASLRDGTGFFLPSRIRTPGAWQGAFDGPDERAYAVLEGIAFSLRALVFAELESPPGVVIHAIGGGSRSDVWLQIMADAFNAPVMRGDGDSLLGAARMAAGRTAAATAESDRGAARFVPDPSRRVLLDKRFERHGGA